MIISELEHKLEERIAQRIEVAADEKSADSKTCPPPLPLHAFI